MEEGEGPRKIYMDKQDITSRTPNGEMASFSELFSAQTQYFMMPMDTYFFFWRQYTLVFLELIYLFFYTCMNQFKCKTKIV